VWRQVAENVAESLHRGARVIVTGRLRQRSYETREGEKRTVYELEVDEIGPSLRYATAKVQKMQRSGGSGGGYGSGGGTPSQGSGGGYADDPWATSGSRRAVREQVSTKNHRSRDTLRTREMAKPPALRKPKKKVNPLEKEGVAYIDYKDTALLRKFISDRGKIRARRVTGVTTQQQRQIARAVKNAREMALLPYTTTGR
jgi:ribosomal protein S18